jgi:hypothetical protein
VRLLQSSAHNCAGQYCANYYGLPEASGIDQSSPHLVGQLRSIAISSEGLRIKLEKGYICDVFPSFTESSIKHNSSETQSGTIIPSRVLPASQLPLLFSTGLSQIAPPQRTTSKRPMAMGVESSSLTEVASLEGKMYSEELIMRAKDSG